jgi:hypothetical protein
LKCHHISIEWIFSCNQEYICSLFQNLLLVSKQLFTYINLAVLAFSDDSDPLCVLTDNFHISNTRNQKTLYNNCNNIAVCSIIRVKKCRFTIEANDIWRFIQSYRHITIMYLFKTGKGRYAFGYVQWRSECLNSIWHRYFSVHFFFRLNTSK